MRGGYRLNAGRKKGFAAKNAEEARRILSDMVMVNIEPIGLALINKAKKGDIAAAKELFDRAFGKVKPTLQTEDRILPVAIYAGLSIPDATRIKNENASGRSI